MSRNFRELLEARWAAGRFVCVGLDSEYLKLPEVVRERNIGEVYSSILDFNRAIVDATHDLVCSYKPNIAFYAAHGHDGLQALQQTVNHIHRVAPEIPVILDAKRADIGSTNAGYVGEAFDYLDADAITVNPYLGAEALQPFLDLKDKGIFVLCRTSNPGGSEFQNIRLQMGPILMNNNPLYRSLHQVVAFRVAKHWNGNGNCGVVVGATCPRELAEIRNIVGDIPILIPGIGAQDGDIKTTITKGADSRGAGMIINSSRGIIFASTGEDFAEAARRETLALDTLVNQYRKESVTQ